MRRYASGVHHNGQGNSGLHLGYNLVVDGDSNTATSFAANSWWSQLGTMLTGYPVTVGANFAVASSQWTNLTSRQAAVNAAKIPGRLNALLLMCGTNDVGSAGLPGADVLIRATSYVTGAVGWDKIVLIDPPPLSANATLDNAINVYRSGIASIPGVSFRVTRSGISQLSNSLDTTYFNDSVHYNQSGWTVLANLVKHTLELYL